MFNFTFAPGTTIRQMVGFEMAGRIWDTYLNDNVTLNLYVGMASKTFFASNNIIGGALPGMRANESYTGLYDRMNADRTSTDDNTAVANLSRTSNSVWFDRWFVGSNGVTTNQGATRSTSTINLTRANAKALGYSFTDSSALDGAILFNNLGGLSVDWTYDYTPSSSGLDSTKLDFLSTAVHEIGHILGFVSGLDRPGWLNNTFNSSTSSATLTAFDQSLTTRTGMTTPLDLFRYSSLSAGKGTGMRDMSYGGAHDKYFSIDKGKTAIEYFSTGTDTSKGGDGDQASHWYLDNLMGPRVDLGERRLMSTVDLRAMDVIGWNVNFNATINLTTLESQAINTIATRAGRTASWVTTNWSSQWAALTQDRTTDVNTMLKNSQIYNWGDETGDGFWQRVFQTLNLQGSFLTVNELSSAGKIDLSEFVGKLNQVDLQSLFDRPTQPANSPSQSSAPIAVEQLQAIMPSQSDFVGASLSNPTLLLPGQGLDAGKIWQIGEKNPVIESEFNSKNAKKPALVSAVIDA